MQENRDLYVEFPCKFLGVPLRFFGYDNHDREECRVFADIGFLSSGTRAKTFELFPGLVTYFLRTRNLAYFRLCRP